jgi:ferric-dicitrate binding protein FerR (iron transport regulator)
MNFPTARDEQAAYWYLRLQDTDVSPEEIQEALRWQRQCAENHAAFNRIEAYWRAWPTVPEKDRSMARQHELTRSGFSRRRWLGGGGAAGGPGGICGWFQFYGPGTYKKKTPHHNPP